MARPASQGLTDGELRIMDVLWVHGAASVGEVVEAIAGRSKPAYNTVLTMLRILERKGYVTHEKTGRAFTYRPLVDRGQERRRALSQVLSRFFEDSPRLLILDLLGHERADGDELHGLRRMIEAQRPEPQAVRRRGGRK